MRENKTTVVAYLGLEDFIAYISATSCGINEMTPENAEKILKMYGFKLHFRNNGNMIALNIPILDYGVFLANGMIN